MHPVFPPSGTLQFIVPFTIVRPKPPLSLIWPVTVNPFRFNV